MANHTANTIDRRFELTDLASGQWLRRHPWHILIVLVLAWSYAPTLFRLAWRWWQNPDYVYGFLVIPFAVFLLWYRREMAAAWNSAGSLWGWALIAFAILLRCVSAYTSDPVFGPLSLIPCLAGVVLLLGGWMGLRWVWPSLVFLVFMIPLPSFVATVGQQLLQRVATEASTFMLQTLGVPAAAYGNVIVMTDGQLKIAQACAGLSSTMLFFAVAVGAAFIVEGLPEKVIVVLSAIPATIIANVFRITATGVLHQLISPELAETVFHDVFGFLMLPLASLIVWGEIALIRKLLVPADFEGPVVHYTTDRTEGPLSRSKGST